MWLKLKVSLTYLNYQKRVFNKMRDYKEHKFIALTFDASQGKIFVNYELVSSNIEELHYKMILFFNAGQWNYKMIYNRVENLDNIERFLQDITIYRLIRGSDGYDVIYGSNLEGIQEALDYQISLGAKTWYEIERYNFDTKEWLKYSPTAIS